MTATTSLTSAGSALREGASVVTANGYVYIIGGWDGTILRDTVLYSKLNSDGSLGTWNTTNVIPAAREVAKSVVVNGYVYVMGGNNAGAQSTVFYAKLNADGTTSTWSSAAVLPLGRASATTVTANGYIYMMGGFSAAVDQSTVYYAKPNSVGVISAWSTNANPLPAILEGATSVAANGYVYVMGGYSAGTAQSAAYYAKLNADGSTGAWVTNANALPAIRGAAASVVANGYVYELGGTNGTTGQSTVYYTSTSRILVNGSLDLVGSNSANLAEGGGTGGSLTAGNTFVAGSLEVTGQSSFWQGASFKNGINVTSNNSGYAMQLQNLSAATSIGAPASSSDGLLIDLGTANASRAPPATTLLALPVAAS